MEELAWLQMSDYARYVVHENVSEKARIYARSRLVSYAFEYLQRTQAITHYPTHTG